MAIFTIGCALVGAIVHFGFHLRDPENVAAAKVVTQDRESATTRVASNKGQPQASLIQRLNESRASNDGISLFGAEWKYLRRDPH